MAKTRTTSRGSTHRFGGDWTDAKLDVLAKYLKGYTTALQGKPTPEQPFRKACPLFPGVTQRIYWSFPDPASFEGTHSEKLARVVQVREAIRSRLDAWHSTLPVAATSSTTRTDLP